MNYVTDLAGAKISYTTMMQTFQEAVIGIVQPTAIKAEPKTMESVLRLMLPLVCDPRYEGYRDGGAVQHAPRVPGFSGTIFRTIAFMFEGAGFKVDPAIERGTIIFEVYDHPEQNTKIINIAVDE